MHFGTSSAVHKLGQRLPEAGASVHHDSTLFQNVPCCWVQVRRGHVLGLLDLPHQYPTRVKETRKKGYCYVQSTFLSVSVARWCVSGWKSLHSGPFVWTKPPFKLHRQYHSSHQGPIEARGRPSCSFWNRDLETIHAAHCIIFRRYLPEPLLTLWKDIVETLRDCHVVSHSS